jgi:hypothetical protein
MKVIDRLVFFLFFILLICNQVYAKGGYYEEEPKVFNGGLILGGNFAQVDGDTYYGYHKAGLNAGGQVYVHFTPKVGMTMELLYAQKGSRGETVLESPYLGTYVTKYFMNLNYVEVPVSLHLIGHGIDFEAGVSYARLINSNEWVLSDQPVVIDPVLNNFNTTDLEYIFGISRKLYKKLYGNIRFQYSITSIRPNDRIPINYGYGNDGQYNNLFSFRMLYLF